MSSNEDLIDESIDDGIPANFLNSFFDGMDNPELQVDETQVKTAEIAQENLKKFNDAWNILPLNASDRPSTSTAGTSDTPPVPTATNPSKELVQASDQSGIISPEGLLGSPSSLQIIDDTPMPSSSADGGPTLNNRAANEGRIATRRRRSDSEGDDGDDDYRRRRAARSRRTRTRNSRSPPESRRSRRQRSRTPGRSRSRYRSRSPRHGRSRQRSRSTPRSRSLSRDTRSSRSSERERRNRSYSRRHRYVDQMGTPATPAIPAVHDVTVMAQSMMAMMQMFNQFASAGNNPMFPMIPGQMGNPLLAASAGQIPQPVNTNPIPSTSSSRETPSANVSTSPQIQSTTTRGVEIEPYDATTELFLEGKIRFGQYLRNNPSFNKNRSINPKVCERVKEAISILDRESTKEQEAKFMYVPPYYYSELPKNEKNRSPLIWNDRNALFGLTSTSREVKHCEPFGNVNGKLKELINKLGLDEGAISQQLQKIALANRSNSSTCHAPGSSSRIQAISTLPPKPGSARMRHVIERDTQTDGYSCGECVERSKKVFVSTGTQSLFGARCKTNVGVQTSPRLDPNGNVPKITLEDLTPSQIETVETIVQFIRTRQVTGPVDAVQHALNKDSTARHTIRSDVFKSAQNIMSMMTESQRPGTQQSSKGRMVISFPQDIQPPPPSRSTATNSNNFQPQIPPPVPPSAHGRYYQPFNETSSIMPACFAQGQPPLSRKAKKRMKKGN